MKNLIATVFAVTLFISSAFAQDVVTMKNGDETKGKIIEVNSTEVKMKKADNPDGPTYAILKSEIFMIVYANGTKEVIATQETETPTPIKVETGPVEPINTPIRYGGPRIGVTFISDGIIAQSLIAQGKNPIISQFGWQFERRFFTLKSGAAGLVEFVPLIGGMEQGLFLASASALIGMRSAKGFEIGLGPNLSQSGFGMIIAAGGSVKSGKVNFPIHLAVLPSISKQTYVYVQDPSGYGTSKQVTMQTGVRISLLVGFNSRSN